MLMSNTSCHYSGWLFRYLEILIELLFLTAAKYYPISFILIILILSEIERSKYKAVSK